jgi:hypothetical protein
VFCLSLQTELLIQQQHICWGCYQLMLHVLQVMLHVVLLQLLLLLLWPACPLELGSSAGAAAAAAADPATWLAAVVPHAALLWGQTQQHLLMHQLLLRKSWCGLV